MASENQIGLSLFNPLNLSSDQKDQVRRNLDIVDGETWSNNAAINISGATGSSGGLVDFPVPSGIRSVAMYFAGVVQAAASSYRCLWLGTRDGTGAFTVNTNINVHNSTQSYIGNTTSASSVQTIFYITGTYGWGNYAVWGKVQFDRVAANTWLASGMTSHISGTTAVSTYVSGGAVLSAELAGIRLSSNGAGYTGGSVIVNWK